MPLFSIIIPTHNRPDFLNKAVSSIREQVFQDWELIVIDDGSDLTAKERNQELIRSCSDSRIRYTYQDAGGPGAARKQGVTLALGRYFVLLDDDDYLLPNHLCTIADWLAQHAYPEFVLNTGLINAYAGGKRIEHAALGGGTTGQDPLLAFWQSPRNLTAFVFPQEVLAIVPIDPVERVIEDFAWLSRVLIHFPLHALAGFTAVYVHHAHNRNNTLIDPAWLSGRIRVVNSAYGYASVAARVPKRVKRALLCHECWHYARQCWAVEEWRLGLRGLVSGLGYVQAKNSKELLYTIYYLVKRALLVLLVHS